MNKKIMMACMLGIGMFALVGCDQDESCDDNWNGKVRTSLAARARTFSNENNDKNLVVNFFAYCQVLEVFRSLMVTEIKQLLKLIIRGMAALLLVQVI